MRRGRCCAESEWRPLPSSGLARKVVFTTFDSSLCSLRISVISALNISRDNSYAEITEIRRDRREDFKSLQGPLFVQSPFIHAQQPPYWDLPELPTTRTDICNEKDPGSLNPRSLHTCDGALPEDMLASQFATESHVHAAGQCPRLVIILQLRDECFSCEHKPSD